ncbi:oxidoreductase [Cryptococcus neoformans]|nr:oxidoreductase [Cryptococcus neoformans var. grubii Th84]OXH06436.1 oxidoreductase [Cryptococcus neoformans var. grubii]OXH28025.1 oxidoreductase [Cryptococcus neoformans var. grubii]OXH47660.1 oxidoreductase [Cryptococcus neoformans var. grubii]OXH51138.1 oxidoreductase [Cryptococcus neoformans var. grubii]
MPSVLLTGITGFLAAHVAHSFLKHGWIVNGTLRSNSKVAAVEAIPEYSPYLSSGKLKLFIVGPLENADYSEAMRGVDAVVHTASPAEFGGKEFRESHLKPALEGTRGVLKAIAKEKNVKSVVYTSTFGAIGDHRYHPTEIKGKVITEDNWNPYTLEELDKMVESGESGNPTFPAGYLFYKGAKKYAELVAWECQKEARDQGAEWPLATMNCVMIWGPPIQPLASLSHGGMSTEFLWMLVGGEDVRIMDSLYPYYVDVRDAAEAHYQAAVRRAQGRFNVSAGPYDFQEFADMLRELYPEQKERFALGTPGKYMYRNPGVYVLTNEKSQRELGITYRPKQETLKDAFDRFFALEKQGLK